MSLTTNLPPESESKNGVSQAHLRMLVEESAISPEVIKERGYLSVTNPSELAACGFTKSQQRSGLLIPIRGTSGEIEAYQLRSDVPRLTDRGKQRKYEWPYNHPLILDIPSQVHPVLGDPSVPLWITEGSKKVDSAVSHGLACIGVVGVQGWRSKGFALEGFYDVDWKSRL